MLNPSQADKIIRQHLPKFGSQRIALLDAYGAILDEEIRADRDMPGFDKALMDGIAIAYSAWKRGERTFVIQGIQSAGQNPKRLQSPHHCFEITTGSVIPHGCDTVVPVEQLTRKGDSPLFSKYPAPRGGSKERGVVTFERGETLRSADFYRGFGWKNAFKNKTKAQSRCDRNRG